MTLVVARIVPSQIRIIADTKITDINAVRSGPLRGALKTVIVDRSLTICFAGNLGRAQEAVEDVCCLRGDGATPDAVISHLEGLSTEGDTDFLVATLSPERALYRIRGGYTERNLPASWIGDADAFAAYQNFFHSTPAVESGDGPADYAVIGHMSMAFSRLVREGNSPTVDGPEIAVMSAKDGFHYVPQAVAFFGRQEIPSGQWTTLRFGSAADGGYAYSIYFPKKAGIGAVGVYFLQGNFGALFHPSRPPAPIVYRDVDQAGFTAAVACDFGFEVAGVGFS